MIQSEKAPTLCPRCEHFTKKHGIPGCAVVADARVLRWLHAQTDESSWTCIGGCPRFENNGSSPHLMSLEDQRALHKLLGP